MSDEYDLTLTLHRAQSLKRADLISLSSDPYVKVYLRGTETPVYISRVVDKTVNPIWKEAIFFRNLPHGTVLDFSVFDKDSGKSDDELGNTAFIFEPKGDSGEDQSICLKLDSEGSLWIWVEYHRAEEPGHARFAGPVRYSCRSSMVAGALVGKNRAWKVFLCDISHFFGGQKQALSGEKKIGFFSSVGLKQQHAALYNHNSAEENGILITGYELLKMLDYGKGPKDETLYYSYVLMDGDWRFSERTSKESDHAMHSGKAPEVYCAGEFCITEMDGGKYKLVVDNNSSVYSVQSDALRKMEALLKSNFPDLHIETVDATQQGDRLKYYHSLSTSRRR